MAYLINFTSRAELDLATLYIAIGAEHSDTAFRWFRGLELAVFSLENNPRRCPFTPESKNLRHLLYGAKPNTFRVIYRIVDHPKNVEILHIRHAAMDRFKPEDLG